MAYKNHGRGRYLSLWSSLLLVGGQEQVDCRAQGGCRQFTACPVKMKSSAYLTIGILLILDARVERGVRNVSQVPNWRVEY
jgi:hypothetical protein